MGERIRNRVSQFSFTLITDREYVESRLKALQKKLSKFSEAIGGDEADAAGIRKQLLQRFNCISCDNPVKMGPQPPQASLPQVLVGWVDVWKS